MAASRRNVYGRTKIRKRKKSAGNQRNNFPNANSSHFIIQYIYKILKTIKKKTTTIAYRFPSIYPAYSSRIVESGVERTRAADLKEVKTISVGRTRVEYKRMKNRELKGKFDFEIILI